MWDALQQDEQARALALQKQKAHGIAAVGF
jgi:hypothetical protein